MQGCDMGGPEQAKDGAKQTGKDEPPTKGGGPAENAVAGVAGGGNEALLAELGALLEKLKALIAQLGTSGGGGKDTPPAEKGCDMHPGQDEKPPTDTPPTQGGGGHAGHTADAAGVQAQAQAALAAGQRVLAQASGQAAPAAPATTGGGATAPATTAPATTAPATTAPAATTARPANNVTALVTGGQAQTGLWNGTGPAPAPRIGPDGLPMSTLDLSATFAGFGGA